MTLTKEQHQKFVIDSQQKLVSFNQLVIKGTTYTQKKIGKYSATFTGTKGADYMVLVSGSYSIVENQNLPVYEIIRKGKVIDSFVIFNAQVVSL